MSSGCPVVWSQSWRIWAKFTHSYDQQLHAGCCRRHQFLVPWSLSSDRLKVFTLWELSSSWKNNPREQHKSCNVFDDLALKVWFKFYISSISPWSHISPILCRRGRQQGVNARRKNYLKILKAAYQNLYREIVICSSKKTGSKSFSPKSHGHLSDIRSK